jgi:hypothetical protein
MVSKFLRKFSEIFRSQVAPLVSMTLATNFAMGHAGVVSIGGKVVKVVNDRYKLPPVSTTPVINLPPVSTTPVANIRNNIRLITP